MNKVQTDNSCLAEKVELRLAVIEKIGKKEVKVLDAYGGNGIVWDFVRAKTSVKIKSLRIDQKDDRDGVYLQGDNVKFLKSMDLSKFDIIDLDAYGSPFHQLNAVFDSGYSGFVIITFIQSVMGRLNNDLLKQLGYTESMISKVPTLFNRNGIEKLLFWINTHGISDVFGYFLGRKNYFSFQI